jgi:alpha-L-rhamnosidase
MKISSISINGLNQGLITDEAPTLSFALESDTPGTALGHAVVRVGTWEKTVSGQTGIVYNGPMEPWTTYPVHITATSTTGDVATASTAFRTGRLNQPWAADWITDGDYVTPRKLSPIPFVFRHRFAAGTAVRRAWIEATALGIYELELNGQRLGDRYFAPGFTSYEHQIQYQTFDVTNALRQDNLIVATVAGGWAVGSYTYTRKNKIYADRQAFLCEIHIEYEDGSVHVEPSSPLWEVTTDGPVRMAEWYDGETYDATVTRDDARWRSCTATQPRKNPRLLAEYGAPVRVVTELTPIAVTTAPSGETIYDFGQNFAGVIHARMRTHRGQVVTFRHAEILVDGELFVESLRTAKATATYIGPDGESDYSPRFTYMGFRYVGVRGIEPNDLELSARVLSSDVPHIGSFACSDPRINRLHDAIVWSGRSNFVDIPTDCPQRDEREGERIPSDGHIVLGRRMYPWPVGRIRSNRRSGRVGTPLPHDEAIPARGTVVVTSVFNPERPAHDLEVSVPLWRLDCAGHHHPRLVEPRAVDCYRLLLPFVRRGCPDSRPAWLSARGRSLPRVA